MMASWSNDILCAIHLSIWNNYEKLYAFLLHKLNDRIYTLHLFGNVLLKAKFSLTVAILKPSSTMLRSRVQLGRSIVQTESRLVANSLNIVAKSRQPKVPQSSPLFLISYQLLRIGITGQILIYSSFNAMIKS